MAQRVIVFWRDIPSQVIVRSGGKSVKRMLADRFQQAIDRAAMLGGARGSDDYMAEWRMADPVPCGDDLEREAQAAQEKLEGAYSDERLKTLSSAGGRDTAPSSASPH